VLERCTRNFGICSTRCAFALAVTFTLHLSYHIHIHTHSFRFTIIKNTPLKPHATAYSTSTFSVVEREKNRWKNVEMFLLETTVTLN